LGQERGAMALEGRLTMGMAVRVGTVGRRPRYSRGAAMARTWMDAVVVGIRNHVLV